MNVVNSLEGHQNLTNHPFRGLPRRAGWQVLLLFTALALLLGTSHAQARGKSFLWVVEGQHNRVYLLGSMHMLPSSAHPLPDAMQKAYAHSEVLVFETDIAEVGKPANQQRLLKAGTYPKGQTLSNSVPGKPLKRLRKVADKLNIQMETLNRYRPWLAALTLEMSAYLKQGFQPDLGVDRYFYERAKKDEKRIITLETLRSQTALFTDLNDSQSMEYLTMTLHHLRDPEDLPGDVLDIWQDGDLRDMEDYVADAQDDYPLLYQRFLRDRNRAWLPTLLDLLRQKENVLFVVGAMHMPGEHGLLTLLHKAGYRPVQQ